jgi:hypothetical protein
MTDLRPCPACHRHVAISESACPFCTTTLAASEPHAVGLGRMSRAAVFATAALAGTACGGSKPKADHVDHAPVQADAGTPAPADAPTPVTGPTGSGPGAGPNNIPMPYGAPPARRRVV